MIARVPIILLLAASLLYPGCSVKEDREHCPAMLRLNLPPATESLESVYVRITSPDGQESSHPVTLGKDNTVVSFPVSGDPFLCTVSSVDFKNDAVRVSEGEPFPQLFLYRKRLHVKGEFAELTPVLAKEFCNLEVSLKPLPSTLSMTVRAAYCGQYAEGELVPGTYAVHIDQGGVVRVPRQGDTSLMLDLKDAGGTVVRSFAIGEYMSEAGYDWNATSLEDISIDVDYARSVIRVSAGLWSRTFDLKVLFSIWNSKNNSYICSPF